MMAGAISVIPIAMVMDVNALGGVQIPLCKYVSVDGDLSG